MSKKIVVLTGSPRKNGNSSAMADAFIKQAEANGHEVTRFDTAFMKFKSCRACDTCYKTGEACSFKDDFNKIAPVMLEADVIVFVTPVYWYTLPSDLKVVVDKMYSFYVGDHRDEISDKQSILMSCAEEDISALDGVKLFYEKTAKAMRWDSVGEILVPGVSGKGEIHNTDAEDRARELANRL